PCRGTLSVAAAILDENYKAPVRGFRGYEKVYRIGAPGYGIFKRILDQRLGDETWHERPLCLRGNVYLRPQSVRKPDLLDVEIELLKSDFLLKGDRRLRIERQRSPKEVGQADRHGLGLRNAPARYQPCDRVQRIEQEVRIELVAKCTDLGRMSESLQRM